MPKTKILICSSEVGAGKRGASLGPDAIRISAVNLFYNIFDQLPTEEIKTKQINKFSPEYKSAKYIKLISQTHQKICRKMAETMREGYNALILSGDHSSSAGFIAGFREAYPDKKLGLIWIDAHGDIHSPYTSPSGNMHGMPIAIMLGYDNVENQTRKLKPEVIKNWEKIKRIGKQKITPKLHPEDIVYIAIRDLEKQEWITLEKLNIKHFTPAIIRAKHIEQVIKETQEHFKDYDALYISFDVDSLDISISIGTGTPVADGLSQVQAEKLISAFTKMPNFRALEISEVNPLLDSENKMATTVVKILRDSFDVQ
ncbi:MAG: arginase [Bacteroidia bacterium]